MFVTTPWGETLEERNEVALEYYGRENGYTVSADPPSSDQASTLRKSPAVTPPADPAASTPATPSG